MVVIDVNRIGLIEFFSQRIKPSVYGCEVYTGSLAEDIAIAMTCAPTIVTLIAFVVATFARRTMFNVLLYSGFAIESLILMAVDHAMDRKDMIPAVCSFRDEVYPSSGAGILTYFCLMYFLFDATHEGNEGSSNPAAVVGVLLFLSIGGFWSNLVMQFETMEELAAGIIPGLLSAVIMFSISFCIEPRFKNGTLARLTRIARVDTKSYR